MTSHRAVTVPVAAVCLALAVAGCTTQTASDDDTGAAASTPPAGDSITVWTLEDVQDRITATEEITEAFTAESGIEVELVAVAEDQFGQLLTSAAAEGDLPDVISALGLSGVRSLAVDDLVDTRTTASIIDSLGEETFSPAALELASDGDTSLAVPSDAWAQLVLYRTDLFEEAGLAPPDTYDALLEAARTLDSEGVAGIAAATTPGDTFTQQTFEHVALANDCQLVDDAGDVTLDSPECVEAFDVFNELITQYSVPGNQDVDTTRATYFAGQSAMVVWSSFLLDELAGLRDDALPTCPECTADPAFLAENTGVVGAIGGPSGEPAQYGDVTSFVVTAGADAAASTQFVEFMMGEAYPDWLALAPEGKIPVRAGTAENPEEFVEAWQGLDAGVDRKAPLVDFYSPEVIDGIVESTGTIDRWGLPQGQGALVGATLGELPVPEVLGEMLAGSLTPEEAAAAADAQVTEIAESLE
ncbi:MAG: ABC transporter substrate-binding protein [Kineosporiaceae bacterium]